MKTVGIIGASGYVGQRIANLLSTEFKVTALQRNVPSVMPSFPGVNVRNIAENTQKFDVVINTSYGSDKDIKRVYQINNEVLEHIKTASHAQTQIIHLSSLAVFGLGLDKPIIQDAVPLKNDYGYVQSKVHMEDILLRHIPNRQLSIVRLGNIWGAANNSWTQPVVDALQWQLPVLSSSTSFSNITYIHNIADYIKHIINHSQHLLFHHLAECSQITWQQVINELSTHLQTSPALIDNVLFYPKTLKDDVTYALSTNPVLTIKKLRDGRFSSHYFPYKLHSILTWMNNLHPDKTTIKEESYQASAFFYLVLSCPIEFKTLVLPEWNVPYNWNDINKEVCNWLRKAGYLVD